MKRILVTGAGRSTGISFVACPGMAQEPIGTTGADPAWPREWQARWRRTGAG